MKNSPVSEEFVVHSSMVDALERRLLFAVHPLSSLPILNSDPSAHARLILDFSGNNLANWGNGDFHPGHTRAFDTDGNPSTFSDTELAQIREIWARVAEKYSPFNINVTTVDTGDYRAGAATKVVITADDAWIHGIGAPSIATTGGFISNDASAHFAWVFTEAFNFGGTYNIRDIAEAAAHEAGHTFGLLHQSVLDQQGNVVQEYNDNNASNDTAPLMGFSYYAQRGLWWSGTSSYHPDGILQPGPYQQDLTILTNANNGFGYRADDAGNSIATAKALSVSANAINTYGIIERPNDSDFYSFSLASAGNVKFTVSTSIGAMLNAQAQLLNANGAVLATGTKIGLGATINCNNLAAGSYRLLVRPADNQYGNLGQYWINGAITPRSSFENGSPPTAARDIGPISHVGSTTISNGIYTLRSSGTDIYARQDAFRFASTALTGDSDLVARVASISATSTWAKAGIMLRAGVGASDPNVFLALTPGHGLLMQTRFIANGVTETIAKAAVFAPVWLKLSRRGACITAYTSSDGLHWTTVGGVQLNLPTTIQAGLAVCSHNSQASCTATFDHVSDLTSISKTTAVPAGLFAADEKIKLRHRPLVK